MKIFKISAFVCLFFFLTACDDGAKRFIPVDEIDDGSSEITDDSDSTDTIPADDDPADTSDITDTSDTTDTTDTSDTSDTTDTTDTADTSDTTDTADTSDTSDTDTVDSDTGDTNPPDPASCSAVFNGNTSKIEVAHNDALNLSSETWTIEAWIKQTGDLTTDEVPIVAKKAASSGGWGGGGFGNDESYTYFLSDFYQKSSWGGASTAMKGSASYSIMMSSSEVSAETTKAVNSGDWTHIALVQTMTTQLVMKKPTITLYINGQKAASDESNVTSNQTPSISTSTEVLLIGSTGTKAFSGLIDSVKISNTAKYTGSFTPAKLSVDSDTVAFWDFSGSADDYENDMVSTPTDITYSTDCAF
ncbi:hypothetical protein J5681_07120 [bacterium]|nr:hypothetical protein [bacterium]